MFHGKPIIGLAGGIGSGKTFVAEIFGEMGCFVITSDQQARAAYNDPEVKKTLRQWWSNGVFDNQGNVNRSAVARKIFSDPADRKKLEQLLHPWINDARQRAMELRKNDPQVLAFVWDTPLLLETGLNRQCDALVYIDTPIHLRQLRVSRNRQWSQDELILREKSQWPLDRKREISDYMIVNTANAETEKSDIRGQVREILSQILTKR